MWRMAAASGRIPGWPAEHFADELGDELRMVRVHAAETAVR